MRGNRGEWSEVYTLIKLLGDAKLYTGDENLNRIQDIVYPILKILRSQSDNDQAYTISDQIVIIDAENDQQIRIPVNIFLENAEILLNVIKNSNDGVFAVPQLESFFSEIRCFNIRANSSSKTDINIIVHDLKTNNTPNLGFSIKSQLGSPSTLFNASKATNFVFRLSSNISNDTVQQINDEKNFQVKFNILNENSVHLIFHDMDSKVFKNNLILIDSYLPDIIGHILILSISSNRTKISELVADLSRENPLIYDFSHNHLFYEYKIKHFLTDVAVGLMSSRVWNGIYDATGGYLVVKEDGDILAYHLYNKNQFENYLFENTRLIRSSTSRNNFGFVYNDGDYQYFKLNLQIRFLK